MRDSVEIENIEELRRQQGIDDVELRDEIRGLRVGDVVKLTLLAGMSSSETLSVRITSIKSGAYRGKLAESPITAGLSKLKAGSTIMFSRIHIHSVPIGKSSISHNGASNKKTMNEKR